MIIVATDIIAGNYNLGNTFIIDDPVEAAYLLNDYMDINFSNIIISNNKITFQNDPKTFGIITTDNQEQVNIITQEIAKITNVPFIISKKD